MGLAEILHRPTQLLIAQCDGPGTDFRLAAMDHHKVGVGADHGQAARSTGTQDIPEILDLVVGALDPGIENEIRRLDRLRLLEGETIQHARVARRHDGEEHLSAGSASLQPAPCCLAGGEQFVIECAGNADLGDALDDRGRAARRVGEDDDAPARLAKAMKRLDRPGHGMGAVVQHAPEIEDEPVVAPGDGRDA